MLRSGGSRAARSRSYTGGRRRGRGDPLEGAGASDQISGGGAGEELPSSTGRELLKRCKGNGLLSDGASKDVLTDSASEDLPSNGGGSGQALLMWRRRCFELPPMSKFVVLRIWLRWCA